MPQMDPPLDFLSSPNLRVLWFNLTISALTGLIFGLAPALRATRPNLAPTLKDQAGAVAGGGQARGRKLLVAVQVGLSLLLLIGAGLFARSLSNLRDLNPGFEVSHLLTFTLCSTPGSSMRSATSPCRLRTAVLAFPAFSIFPATRRPKRLPPFVSCRANNCPGSVMWIRYRVVAKHTR